MAQSKHNTQKKLIKVGDIVKFTDVYVLGSIKAPVIKTLGHNELGLVVDGKIFNNEFAHLVMTPNGAKQWVKKERIRTISSLE
jgi:hypothetical protein